MTMHMHRVKNVLRIALWTAVVLLIGQVPYRGLTIGANFLRQVFKGQAWIASQFQEQPWVSKAQVGKLWKTVTPPPKPNPPAATHTTGEHAEKGADEVTSSDRESLIELLE